MEEKVRIGSRDTGIVRTSIVGIVANVLLAAFKAAVGALSNSIAIVLDAVNNLSDAFSSVITIVGTKLAGRRPTKKYPFGFGRVEYMTTIIIGVIVLFAGFESLQESVNRILDPEVANYDAITLAIVAVAVVAKIILGRYTKSKGEEYASDSLVASGTDATMDSIISASTLAAAFIFIFSGISLEAWLGAVISIFIIKAGVDILREAIGKVLGERVSAETSRAVREVVESEPGVLGAYDLILNDYGPDRLMGSVHIEVAEGMAASAIDQLTRRIQKDVHEKTDVLLHTVGVYSVNADKTQVAGAMRARLDEIAQADEDILQVHGLYVDEGARIATFDVVVGFDADDRHAVLESAVDQMRRAFPGYAFYAALDSDITD